MVLKLMIVNDIREHLALLFIIQIFQETELLSWYDSFIQKMVLKRLFFSDLGEDFALHIHYSGLPRDRPSSQYPIFTERMILK